MNEQEEIARLLELAQADVKVEQRPLSEVEKFILKFELTSSETSVVPMWAIYRAYRLWSKKPLTIFLFRREIVKYFKKADKRGATYLKSYFVNPGKVDLSEEAQAAERRHRSSEKKRKNTESWENWKKKITS